ncbi:hypothetical protein K144313037_16550 [Clostridium tetani]|uniref:hypothetical protein n=1 Tax=Clostridium tetani TaxID=1513 RepID=UPI0002E53529|nr:hypothetical protein [Clostridium tetani]CDI49988.1 hypothetical protein BN906_01997 [Clostridium tetani 12124569]WFN61183.1 hypothetical protein PAA20_09565 [Clostridium tetani]SJZ43778.1 hypothetical protein SAMN02745112_00140 [Clostridium tetani]SUY56557.1 Uncharacterised protein [Clostridium tetani]SUY66932.1 Uncharacterised protein [Clostridium tetani]
MDKNMEMMKKLIEQKKKKGDNFKNNKRAEKSIGKISKGGRRSNGGGLFDK